MVDSTTPNDDSASSNRGKQNPFFAMVLCSASIFILTILAMVAALFGDPRAPVAKFLNAHAGRLIGAEVVVTLVVGLCALVVDRLQSRRRMTAEHQMDDQTVNLSEKSNKN